MLRHSIGEWQRETDLSLKRSRERRQRTGMLPRGSEWREFFAFLTLMLIGAAALVAAAVELTAR